MTKLKQIKGRHPFVALYETYRANHITEALGHSTHATISIYAGRCRKDKDYLIPAEWVLPLCRVTGGEYQPHQLRPDLYLPEWKC